MPAHARRDQDAGRSPNRLAKEASPYLLQHAHNPVDWHPWGPEAFAEARRRQVPIFLSVGYSTCYWCHVMERESFENEGIARQLNDNFVCIKVDREERPDVDDIYMAAVQLMTQRGGWPMSVWLTPPGARDEGDRGLEPFYAGTYFPAEPRHGMTSFPEVLSGIAAAWKDQRPAVLEQAARVTDAVREQIVRDAAEKPIGARQVGQAVATLLRIHDPNLGGFGGAPKFPQPVFLEFLFETLPAFDDPAVAATVKRSLRLTLDRMALGGMFDQVGGGFHRYSTDERWLVPHFEKMLYDQGQLASAYARAYREWGDEFDAHILRRVCDYVLREMTSLGGAFYSAQDAEVNHREGWNYLWTREQLIDALGEDEGEFAAKVYGVDAGPNFRDPHDKFALPSNVLFLADRPEQTAEQMGMAPAEFAARLSRVNERLYSARAKRDQPALDDKVIVAWNGLMIAGLADAAAALKEPKYLDAARRASAFIDRQMRAPSEPEAPARDLALVRIWRRGAAGTPAFLEDYAMLMRGLLACHRAGVSLGRIDDAELETARLLWESARRRFEDRDRPGLLHDTLPDQSDLIVRAATTYDGAMPSGASVMLNNLIDLYELTGERDWLREASRVLAALSAAVAESPIASVNSTRGLNRLLRIDPALVESIGGGAPAEEVVRLPDAPVQVFASAERVVVPRAGPAELALELRIREGFHITAHEPGVEGLSPLLIEVRGGTGVRASVAYPPGTPYTGEALPPEDRGRMMVHEGTLRLNVMLARTDEAWAGRPMLVVTYQACDDRACFQPMTVELDVALDEEREGAAR